MAEAEDSIQRANAALAKAAGREAEETWVRPLNQLLTPEEMRDLAKTGGISLYGATCVGAGIPVRVLGRSGDRRR